MLKLSGWTCLVWILGSHFGRELEICTLSRPQSSVDGMQWKALRSQVLRHDKARTGCRKLHGSQRRGFIQMSEDLLDFSSEHFPVMSVSFSKPGSCQKAATRAALWLWLYLDDVCAEMAMRVSALAGNFQAKPKV